MFTAIDIVILIILGFGAYRGFKKGLLLEIVSFVALVIAVLTAFKLLHLGINWLTTHYSNLGSFIPYLAFVAIFILTFLAIHLLGRFLKSVVDLTLLGSFDSFAGGILGLIKTAFLISVFIWLTHHAKLDLPNGLIANTYIYPHMIGFAPSTVDLLANILPLQDIFPSVKRLLQRS